jgi:thymidylate synthase (FAD)
MTREELLSKWSQPIKVGCDGHVRLVDVMGDDSSIVQAARVSYGKGTKTVLEDRGLIRYLFKHKHSSPVEMCEIKLHVRVPVYIWRQWIRHRTASTNEYSARYSEAIDSRETTDMHSWRQQSTDNKQGSSGLVPEEYPFGFCVDEDYHQTFFNRRSYLTAREEELHDLAKEIYEERLSLGVAREQARKDLPLSTYTEAYWKIDAHNLLHFLKLRLDHHAQQEIREFGETIAKIVRDWLPLTWEAFEDYQLNAKSFSAQEMSALRAIVSRDYKFQYTLQELAVAYPKMTATPEENQRGLEQQRQKLNESFLKWNEVDQIALLRHHGLTNRRECREFIEKLKST